jgi:hypothetical protein
MTMVVPVLPFANRILIECYHIREGGGNTDELFHIVPCDGPDREQISSIDATIDGEKTGGRQEPHGKRKIAQKRAAHTP